MSNAILTRIQLKVDELGPEQAARYFSGHNPGKKITPAQLAKVLSGEDMPTPRMCLRVVEDLEGVLTRRDTLLSELEGRLAELDARRAEALENAAENIEGRRRIIEAHQERINRLTSDLELYRSQSATLANDNAALLARIRELDARAVAQSGVAAQGFSVQQSFAPVEVARPAARQPWEPLEARERPADLQPWQVQTRTGMAAEPVKPYGEV